MTKTQLSIYRSLLIIIIILLTACEVELSPVLTGSTCAPPCWYGITPGQTTKQDLASILSNIPVVDQKTITNKGEPWEVFSDIYYFYLTSREKVSVYMQDDIVVAIGFGEVKSITFSDLIIVFGDPAYIMTSLGSGDYTFFFINAIYSEEGVAFGHILRESPIIRNADLRPTNKINTILFFDPESYDVLLKNEMFGMYKQNQEGEVMNLFPWDGYGRIQEKYKPE